MKGILTITLIVMTGQVFSQSMAEVKVLALSKEIFNWEVGDKVDSLENIFHEKLVVVNGLGVSQDKKQYLANLRSGNFVHNSIEVEENTAMVVNNTATVVGKGKFTVTSSGNKSMRRLSYIEVFTRVTAKEPWKLLAIHATVLQN
jgi:hypothetical protein